MLEPIVIKMTALTSAAAGLGLGALLAPASVIALRASLRGAGRRWLVFVAAPSLALALIILIAGAPVAVAALFLFPITLRTRWLDPQAGLGRRGLLFAGAVLALALGQAAAGWLPPFPSAVATMIRIGATPVVSFTAALALKLLCQFPGRIFSRFRLRTRLLTSYVLVAAIPVILIVAFLFLAAYLMMGSYRASVATRLLAPDAETRRALAQLADSVLARGSLDGLDRLAPARLPASTTFLMASSRELADTTRFARRWIPRDSRRDSVPRILAGLREYLPGEPAEAIVQSGDTLFVSTAVTREKGGAEFVLRAFSRLDPERVTAAAGALEADIEIITGHSRLGSGDPDTAAVSEPGVGVTIDLGDGQGPARPRWLLATAPHRGGTYAGAQLLPGFRPRPDGGLSRHDMLVLVKFPPSSLVGILRNTSANPFNVAVLVALGVIGALFLIVEAAALVIGGAIARNINRSVALLHQGTRRLADDDLDHRLDTARRDELGELAASFNVMAQGLKERRRLALEREHMDAELLVARSIQRRLLPSRVPDLPGLDVAGTSIPSREVGGDAYDFLLWGDKLLVSVADVAGKGVPAALLMSNLQAGLRSQAQRPGALGCVLAELNELILAATDPGRFITLAIALIDPRGDSLAYASAGHLPPLVRRADGRIETLTDGGLILGVLAGAPYEETRIAFGPGDAAVLYTDGVVEAMNPAGDFFGDDRLVEVLGGAAGLDAAAICHRIVRAVQEFEGGAGGGAAGDDLTVVVVRRTEDGRA